MIAGNACPSIFGLQLELIKKGSGNALAINGKHYPEWISYGMSLENVVQ